MATRFKTLKEYFFPDDGNKVFIIPNYQRGYKWSVKNGEQTSVEYLMDSLLNAYHSNREQQFFLQGVTVAEDGDNITIIDGQQRTTTLYLLLYCLGIDNITGKREIALDYSIRQQSKIFLEKLKDPSFNYEDYDTDDTIQDIFYFKRAIEQILTYCKDFTGPEKEDFINYLMHKISFLYIVIDPKKAVRTFTMMNGHQAKMHDEELVKAEVLHLISMPEVVTEMPLVKTMDDTFAILKEIASVDWETNALRSRYAREWDKWLYWWNRKDVKAFFNTNNPMGLLLEYYYYNQTSINQPFSFRKLNMSLLSGEKKKTKDVFKGLRDLQKDFEDIFRNAISFNCLKMSLIGSNSDAEDKYNIIMYFINHKHELDKLKEYSKWRLLGATHIEITEEYTNDPTVEGGRKDNSVKRRERAQEMISYLSKSDVYTEHKLIAFKQLLRLNVEEYNKLNDGNGLKFDFSIWERKSLEHIYPKSCFYHVDTDPLTHIKKFIRGDYTEIQESETTSLIDSDKEFTDPQKYSEHCIGNLVLMYGNNNSEFGALGFDEKKARFFNNERPFESRNLLHTISVFASSKWKQEDIERNANKIIEMLKDHYKV